MVLTKDKSFYRQFFSLLLFIAVQNLVVYSVSLADNVMLGRYSEEALSGVALANQIQFLLQMITNGVGEGLVVLSAQYWGKRETRPMCNILCSGLIMAVFSGAVFMLAGLTCPYQLLHLLCPDDEAVLMEGVKYMKIISFTYILFGVDQVLLAQMRSVENVRIGLYSSLTALFANVGLNYLLIFGKLGFPALGTQGAAIATLISRVIETAVMLVYVLKIDKKLRLKFSQLFAFNRLLWSDYIRTATPVILSGMSWGIAMFLQTAILGRMGSACIAANSIAASLFSIISVVAYGGSNTAAIVTGKLVGEGDRERLHECVNTMQLIFLGIGLISGAALFAAKDLIIGFYDVQESTRALARQFLSILSITLIGTSYQVACLTGIVRGGGHTKFVFYNDLVFMWGIVLPASFLCAFVFKTSPAVVFFCLKADQILKCFVAVFEVNSYRWVRKLTRSETQLEENIA